MNNWTPTSTESNADKNIAALTLAIAVLGLLAVIFFIAPKLLPLVTR